MNKLVLIGSFLFVFFIMPIQAQVNFEWSACYNGPVNDYDAAQAIFVDHLGNVYITGGSSGSSGGIYRPDYVTIKYDQQGNELWVRRYGQFNVFQVGRDLTVDHNGNVYVTGGSQTLKYDDAGNLLWVVGNDAVGYRIILDGKGNIYAGATSYGDIKLLKISSAGNIIWQQFYNGPANYLDDFTDMAMDSKGNIIITGKSHGIGTHWDYAIIKYSPSGDSLWVRRYNGPSTLFPGDYPYAITVDDEDNVYVTGWSDANDSLNNNAQCFTIAFSSTGDTIWQHRYEPTAFAGYDILYSEGFIYVVAMSSFYGVVDLLKYDKHGNLVGIVPGMSYGSVVLPPRLAVDNEGYIYLSGARTSSYTVSKISPDVFSVIWVFQYPDVFQPGGCFPSAMVIDKSNNIYITGESHSGSICPPPGTGADYLTIKISQDKVSVDPQTEIVTEYELHQNYPNPFNPVTTIKFSLPKKEFVTLKIYDLLGKELRTLVSEERHAGIHSVTFNAEGLSSGVYYYRLTVRQAGSMTGEFTQTRKLILLR
jgi:hypothetical protein